MEVVFEAKYSLDETKKVAQGILPWVQLKKRVLFKGEIGAGKTTLVKHLAVLLGVDEVVDSPTFSLVNEYQGQTTIHHFDLYRIESEAELWDIGWEDYLDSNGHLWVEWPERAPGVFDDDFLIVKIESNTGLDSRNVQVIVLD